ncbi:MAG: hypothetical protein M3384_18815 [Acidobacteriota bacterium]|nr:hypothetical protein [Acidobacteriota bacterium]
MLRAIFITSFFGLLIFCQTTLAQKADIKTSPSSQQQDLGAKYPSLAKQADEMVKAAAKNDFAKFVGYMHPKVIERTGGKEKFIGMLKQITKELESAGVSVVTYSVEKPSQIIEAEKQIFAVLPTRARVKTPEGIVTVDANLIGISADGGSNWKFVRVDNKQSIKSLFPGIADKLEIFKATN